MEGKKVATFLIKYPENSLYLPKCNAMKNAKLYAFNMPKHNCQGRITR
jgi:hypothetical protein